MRRFYYLIYNLIFKRVLHFYLKTDSHVNFDGFKLTVFKEVFHPKLFFSTKYFYSFLSTQNFNTKSFLEVGCGSGILCLLAYKKGANVTAVDINEKAVENTLLNFSKNFSTGSTPKIIKSNLFKELPQEIFDFIAINPPYYFKKVDQQSQLAWYCGENGEYFQDLFKNLPKYMGPETKVFMILEERCEIERIKELAARNKLYFELIEKKLIKWETNYIYKIYLSR
jgi:release factor glutamine methyltransferase